MDLVAKLRTEPESLKSLHLDPRTELKGEFVRTLAEALEGNTTLESLSLVGNMLGGEGASIFCKPLRGNPCLSSLNIVANGLGPAGAGALAESLSGNTALVELRLGDNLIGGPGTALLVPALCSCSALTLLDMRDNGIGDQGAVALADLLRSRPSNGIKTLYLEWNGIETEGGDALLAAVRVNRHLTTCTISPGNPGFGLSNRVRIEDRMAKRADAAKAKERPQPGTPSALDGPSMDDPSADGRPSVDGPSAEAIWPAKGALAKGPAKSSSPPTRDTPDMLAGGLPAGQRVWISILRCLRRLLPVRARWHDE